ncbi:glycosyltransferase [Acidipropionibacterium virtanenii]|uniref:N-acetyl-alpha-D-glucosaminyl L-malate synthase n=1 Tax=Acidipropionibacterium virtanenii TaxID=2057246 RepID=A0A344UXJ6_9ACTN|nr:glycosyltransferase [Acidipropionibacterium virtanenii]AXE39994.1 N-acetyl-alpha-D-glucosaminyl L-malate synthase [Acidipropionibacterium virtanenii]
MPDPRTLFLLTNVYPLSKGEEFIENEIEHLARRFSRVIIVATQTLPGDVITRSVPDNVEVITAGKPRPSGRAMIPSVAAGLRKLPLAVFSQSTVRHPSAIAVDALFEQRARASADELLGKLPALNLQPGSHVVIYSFWFHTTARVGMLLAADLRARGVVVDRLVSRAHGYDLYENRNRFGHLPERRLLLDAYDAVRPVSAQGTRALHASWPGFADEVATCHLGTVDPGRAAKCSREPFHIISCAFLIPVKRMTRMPAILAELRRRGVDARWTHLGDGPDTEMAALREAVHVAGVDDSTQLLGHIPNADIIETECSLSPSCLINLSSSEGLPVSMMEAASLGIPLIGTDVGGVSEIITDRVNGRLLDPEHTDTQAADALQWLAELPEDDYRGVCGASRRIWQTNYDQAVVYPRFCAEVLGASS